MRKKISNAGLIVLISCGVMTGCKQAPQTQTNAKYAIMSVAPSNETVQSSYSVSIRGRQDIDIYPQVSGTITRLCVTEGEAVKKDRSYSSSTRFLIRQLCKQPWPM